MNTNNSQPIQRIMVIAGKARSLVNFRGPLLQTLRAKGLEVHAAAPDLTANAAVYDQLIVWGITPHNVTMQRAGMNPVGDLGTMRALFLLMRKIRPDAVLAYTIKPVVYGTLAAWLARVPYRFALITGLGYAFTGEASRKRAIVLSLVRKLYAAAMKRSYKVFFQNPDDQALFIDQGILPKSIPSIVLNGSGVDVDYFAQEKLPTGAPSFLLIARLIADKGVRQYAEAAKLLRDKYPDSKFRLVGDLDDNPSSISRAELNSWIEAGVIDYLGLLDDVRPALAQSSVFVLPTYYREGTPRTVLEAMAMGRPVITTDAPGCRETVTAGDNGFLVPVKNVEELVAAMQKIIEQPSLVAQMGKRSRERAVERYDVHKVNGIMLEEMEIT